MTTIYEVAPGHLVHIKTSEWHHDGNDQWSLWDLVEEPVPVPEFIRQQAKGKMKMSQGQIWEYVTSERWGR